MSSLEEKLLRKQLYTKYNYQNIQLKQRNVKSLNGHHDSRLQKGFSQITHNKKRRKVEVIKNMVHTL